MIDYDDNEAPFIEDEFGPTDAELDAATDLLRTTEERDATQLSTVESSQDGAALLASVLFEPEDFVLNRPTETWIEDGKKESRVDFKGTTHHRASALAPALEWHRKRSEETKCNLFFGVAPRHGVEGKFDKAWQIRTIRALWADIDDGLPEAVLQRCTANEIPAPTALVASGRGTHCYWALSEEYRINCDPRPVETEWPDKPDPKTNRKKPRQYIVDANGEKLYQDIPANRPELAPEAQLAQDVMAGIGSLIGGDDTFDLSRLLRWPDTWNRKDQRNGRPPVLCKLHSIDPSKRYSFEEFVKFAAKSPAKERRNTVATVKLPAVKKLTAKRRDKLSEFVLECGVAADRSAADWALVCWAIENGVDKEEVWSAVNHVGKFADKGREYFDRTWDKAASCTQEKIYKAAEKRVGKDVDDDEEDGDGEAEGLTAAEVADAILADDEHFAQDGGGRLYWFDNGRYCPKGDQRVKTLVKAKLRKMKRDTEWTSRLATEVIEYLRVDSPKLWDAPPDDVLCVQNGLLDVTTLMLKPHSAGYLSPVQLPVKFDPQATCPKIEKFVGEVFPEDNPTLAYEIVAYSMLPDISIQKAVLLLGEGGNGKSRYLMMVNSFLGQANVSGVSLHRLESDKFAAARLYGKLANICPDLPSEHLAGTSVFKAIVGGDIITGEEKYFSSFEYKVFCKLLFSANSPPRANDASEGFFDRWLVALFNRRFRGVEGIEIRAAALDAMLSEPSEQSGLLNKALAVLPGLRARGRFTESASTREAFAEFHATTDPLAVWLDGATIDDPEAMVLKDALHAAYTRYSSKRGVASMTKQRLALKLQKLRPHVAEAQRKVGGKDRQHVWLGIGLRSEQRPETAQSSNGSNGGNGLSLIPIAGAKKNNDEVDLFSDEISGEEENSVTSVTDVTDTWEAAVRWD